jgi:hypothetical protein
MVATTMEYTLRDCMATDPAFMQAWTNDQRAFCCSHLDVGCGATPSQMTKPAKGAAELDFRKFDAHSYSTDGSGAHTLGRWAQPISNAASALPFAAVVVMILAIALASVKLHHHRQGQLQRAVVADLPEIAPGGQGGTERSRLLATEQC